MKFRRATHDRAGNYVGHKLASNEEWNKVAEPADPLHWMDRRVGMTLDEIHAEMVADDTNWEVKPSKEAVAIGLVRLLEIGYVEVVANEGPSPLRPMATNAAFHGNARGAPLVLCDNSSTSDDGDARLLLAAQAAVWEE
jgi:hypothetical protein